MRIISYIILSLIFAVSASAKGKTDPSFSTKVYMYAISASFNDSTVYITDVQEVDSAYLVKKTFLGGLKRYTEQLDSYFKEKYGERRTNTVFFKTTRKKAEKQYVKLRKRYTSGDVKLVVLPTGEFTFTAVRPYIEADEYANMSKKEIKEAKKKKKAEAKAARQKEKEDKDGAGKPAKVRRKNQGRAGRPGIIPIAMPHDTRHPLLLSGTLATVLAGDIGRTAACLQLAS